jgi:hypothetical protein
MNGGNWDWTLSSLLSAARTRVRLGPDGAKIPVMTADRLRRSAWSSECIDGASLQHLDTVCLSDNGLEAESMVCLCSLEESAVVIVQASLYSQPPSSALDESLT